MRCEASRDQPKFPVAFSVTRLGAIAALRSVRDSALTTPSERVDQLDRMAARGQTVEQFSQFIGVLDVQARLSDPGDDDPASR